jgi:hypothetical protein
MRGAFGLVGILVVVGIIFAFIHFTGYPEETLKQGNKAKEQASQMAGQDSQGVKAADSITLDPLVLDGKVRHVRVAKIMPDGPMAKHFGLMKNDSILAVGPLELKDQDEGFGKILIVDAYAKQMTLTVMRNGEKITLPGGAKVGSSEATAPGQPTAQGQPTAPGQSTAPGQPAAPQKQGTQINPNEKPLSRQLRNIPGLQAPE